MPTVVCKVGHMPNDATGADPLPLLLTPAQVADMLQVSREQVYRWCASGELPSIVLAGSRARRVRRDDLERWVAEQPSRPDAAA